MSIVIGHKNNKQEERNLKKENCLDGRLVPAVPNNFTREHFPVGTRYAAPTATLRNGFEGGQKHNEVPTGGETIL